MEFWPYLVLTDIEWLKLASMENGLGDTTNSSVLGDDPVLMTLLIRAALW